MTGSTHRFIGRAIATAVAVSLAACSGGHGSGPLPTAPSQPTTAKQSATAQMVVKIPPKPMTTAVRSPQYISASTQSMTVGVLSTDGKSTTQIAEADLTPSSPNCSAVTGGGTQCSVNVVASAGQQTFVLNMYDQTGGKGNLLSTGNVAATLVSGQNTSVPLVLDGVATTSSVVLGTGSLPVGTPGTTSVTINAQDAGGNYIVGPGNFATPITLAISGDAHNTLSLSSNTIKAPGQIVTLSYTGGSNVGSTITPSLGTKPGTATFNATGVALNMFTFQDPADSINYAYADGAVAALPDGSGVIEMYDSFPFLDVVSPTGTQSAYVGAVTDPYATPAPSPSPGATATPAPYQNITVVPGMSKNLAEWWGEQDHSMATDPDGKIWYGASETSANDPNCSSGTSYFGAIGKFDPVTKTASETLLKGVPMYVYSDSNGNIWFIETGGSCNNGWNNPQYFPSGYAIGELSKGGTLKETDLGSTGFPSGDYPSAMSITADGSQMYIADWDNDGSIYNVATATLSGATSATPANSKWATALATAPDGTTLWFSDNDPGDYYYWGALPAGKACATANIVENAFPVNYFYGYDAVYADGSFWLPGDDYNTGMGRISGLNGSSPLTNYYQLPYPDEDGQELTGVAAGGGYVWSADWEYGEIDAFQYGAPSSATMTLSMQRHTMATISAPKNPAVHTLVHAHYGRTIRSTHAK